MVSSYMKNVTSLDEHKMIVFIYYYSNYILIHRYYINIPFEIF